MKRMNRGGLANSRGALYEEFFAVFRVIDALFALTHGQGRQLAQQCEGTRVDDFVEKYGGHRHHFQLKRKLRVGWSEVHDDFVTELGHGSRVTLVVPSRDQRRALLAAKRRVQGAEVLVFPAASTPNEACAATEVRTALDALSVKTTPHHADRLALWNAIRLAWENSRKPGQFVSCRLVLSRFVDQEDILGPLPLRMPWTPSKRWNRARRLLQQIPSFSFRIEDGQFVYDDRAGTSGTLSCRTRAFRAFVDRVVKSRPTTLQALVDLL